MAFAMPYQTGITNAQPCYPRHRRGQAKAPYGVKLKLSVTPALVLVIGNDADVAGIVRVRSKNSFTLNRLLTM